MLSLKNQVQIRPSLDLTTQVQETEETEEHAKNNTGT